jgi:hypothetical protein
MILWVKEEIMSNKCAKFLCGLEILIIGILFVLILNLFITDDGTMGIIAAVVGGLGGILDVYSTRDLNKED